MSRTPIMIKEIINFSLKQASFVIVASIGFLVIAVSMMAYGYQKMSFFPPIYANNFRIQLEMAPGTNEDITENKGFTDLLILKIK